MSNPATKTAMDQPLQTDTTNLLHPGGVAFVTAILANLVVRAVAGQAFDLPAEFRPLEFAGITIATAIGVFGAIVAFWLIRRVSDQPIRTFRIVAIAALLVSMIPNILLLIVESNVEAFAGSTTTAVITLMVMHVVAAAIVVGVLTTKRATT